MAFAHSQNSHGQWQDLIEHLTNVAKVASQFVENFCASDLAKWVGLWHDIGKFHPAFQSYLTNPVTSRGPDHKGAGALLALKYSEPLAFLVAGHHGGLQDLDALKAWLREKKSISVTAEALALARAALPSIEPESPLFFPSWASSKTDTEFFLRMLFSALTDADFLDTERHFAPDRFAMRSRGSGSSIGDLLTRFERNQATLTGKQHDRVNRIRHEVYQACLKAAELPPGFFRLTVPTGGGKTRSSLAFALRHSLQHGMQRVIIGIPYTSIIEQTASVFRKVLGKRAVLEHHSAVTQDDPENPTPEEVQQRLASENWDAPVVVTTTVQLFESLFANKPSRCRKLHNIARSVLILDEVQTLPTHLLQPVLDVLRQLVAHYGVSVVLCTATQPALQESAYLRGLPDVREIVPEPSRFFAELKRVRYEWAKGGAKVTWQEVADEIRKERQALAVVNTKADALALLDILDDPEALHLSTLMCGGHRRDALNEIRARLENGAPCRLVSTQVVEAGVDLDFPLVLRALGPLDRIVQAAGRCNREGKLAGLGRVVVFEPEQARLPNGPYRTGTAVAAMQLLQPGFDFDDPQAYERYFQLLYQAVELDTKNIQELRNDFCFEEVSRRFRMIEEDTVPVIVRYQGPKGDNRKVDLMIDQIRQRPESLTRDLFRQLQPYLVSMRRYEALRSGSLCELRPGLYEWTGTYHPVRGVSSANPDPGALVV